MSCWLPEVLTDFALTLLVLLALYMLIVGVVCGVAIKIIDAIHRNRSKRFVRTKP